MIFLDMHLAGRKHVLRQSLLLACHDETVVLLEVNFVGRVYEPRGSLLDAKVNRVV